MKCGNKIGPIPVSVHDKPVAIRRFSLKYVFNASEFADEFIPDPSPMLKSNANLINSFELTNGEFNENYRIKWKM